jgi:hypothetical protein
MEFDCGVSFVRPALGKGNEEDDDWLACGVRRAGRAGMHE